MLEAVWQTECDAILEIFILTYAILCLLLHTLKRPLENFTNQYVKFLIIDSRLLRVCTCTYNDLPTECLLLEKINLTNNFYPLKILVKFYCQENV
jgi:hypothetical protein